MEKPSIILIGGGEHCKSCIDVIEQENKFEIFGILDLQEKVGQKILSYPIIGTDNDIEHLAKENDHFIITLGQIKSPELRIKLFKKIKDLGKFLPTIISPRAYISEYAKVGQGSIIMHDVIVNASSIIGQNCTVNTGALIEHDTVIKDNCHISTQATINGNCTVNSGSFIGSNSTLNHGVSIANNCIIGSGSVVLKNILDENSTWVGNPATMK